MSKKYYPIIKNISIVLWVMCMGIFFLNSRINIPEFVTNSILFIWIMSILSIAYIQRDNLSKKDRSKIFKVLIFLVIILALQVYFIRQNLMF